MCLTSSNGKPEPHLMCKTSNCTFAIFIILFPTSARCSAQHSKILMDINFSTAKAFSLRVRPSSQDAARAPRAMTSAGHCKLSTFWFLSIPKKYESRWIVPNPQLLQCCLPITNSLSRSNDLVQWDCQPSHVWLGLWHGPSLEPEAITVWR